jgi:hypothetical protein
MAYKPREEMPIQRIHEEEVVFAGALIEMGVADISIE